MDQTDDKDCPIRIRHLEDVLENDSTDLQRRLKERPLRYEHLCKDQFEIVDKLLRGGIDLNKLPCQQKKVVRVFICSSGQDFEAERNYLFESVYPLVRQYCRDNHGVDFQIVDMYWGTCDMPCNDPRKMAAIHEELRYCRKTSMGPYFVAFFGQKYGNYRVPIEISSEEMETIKFELSEAGRDISVLEHWYLEDNNVNPNIYRLRTDGKIEAIQEKLVELLSAGAKGLSEADAKKYSRSEFEDFVRSGIIDNPENQERAVCAVYMRDIDNIQERLHAKNAGCFVDLIENTCIPDDEKAKKLKTLKKDIEGCVDEENIHKSVIHLNGCTLDESKSSDYINGIGKHFYKFMTDSVEKRVLSDKDKLFREDDLCNEVARHWGRSRVSGAPFVGREDILNGIKGYILSETDHPLVIYGPSGCGKTSLIAKAANDINEAIANGHLSMPTAIITRFMRETGKSEDIQPFLLNICHQLAYIMGKYRQDIPSEFKSLKNYFIDIVQTGEFGGMIVILIDSLDMLSDVNDGGKLTWLPPRLSENIKIIVTVDENNDKIMQRFTNKIDMGLIRMPKFLTTESENLIKVYMSKENQTVSYNQWKKLHMACSSTSLLLFTKLLCIESLQWRSYDDVTNTRLSDSICDFVVNIFEKLETKHGKYIVSRVLGYLTASKSGLSESELEDILSLDNNLLNHIFVQRHQYPNIYRFPSDIWVRLRQDISPYLVEKEVDNISVLTWRYKVFQDEAKNRYCKDGDETTSSMFSTMADYYLGTWAGTKTKPFRHPTVLMAKYKLVDMDDASCRFVPEQPLVFGTLFYNKRKMSQLPYYLNQCGRKDDMREMLCNYDFLMYKLKLFSIESVLSDFSYCTDRETNLVGEAVRMSKSAIFHNPKALGMELTGRLLSHINKSPCITQLIRQCDLEAQKSCPLVANCQIYSAPGGPLEYECDISGNRNSPVDIDVVTSPDGILLMAKPRYSSRLRIWELECGEERPDIKLPLGDVRSTRDGRYINIFVENKKVKIFRSDSGVQYGEVDFGPGHVADCEVSSKYIAFSVHKGAGPYVIDIERSEILHKFTYHTHAVAISTGETFLAFNSERSILLYELPLMKRQCVATATDVPNDILFINEKPKCYVLTKSKLVESITFNITNRKYTCKTILTDLEAKECILSNSKTQMILRCNKTLHILDTYHDKVVARIQKLPAGVFVDTNSVFSGAGFTPNDWMVVATRYTYLIVWDSVTFEPVRVLQSAISPMIRIFTSSSVNKVVSLLENNYFQVWNLDNIDQDILHAVEVHKGSVKSVAVKSSSPYIISHDNGSPDAKLVSVASGKVIETLQHSEDETDRVMEVRFSQDGAYAVTRARVGRIQPTNDLSTFTALTDDVLWEVETATKVFHAMANRFIVFSPISSITAFVTCSVYNRHDWSENIYNVFIVNPENSSNYTIDFPYNTEFVSEPCIVVDGGVNYFLAVIQGCKRNIDSKTNKETSRLMEVRLFIQKLTACEALDDPELLRVTNFYEHLGALDKFIGVKPIGGSRIIAVYVKNTKQFEFEIDKGIIHPKQIDKGLFVYDVGTKTVLQHILYAFTPTTSLDSLRFSTSHALILDESLRLFNGESFSIVGQLDSSRILPRSARFAMDGKYVVAISRNGRSVVVIRTHDRRELGAVFVHGRAECLEVSDDERTVVVGVNDGRVMIFSLILEFSDPLREYIEKLPSRSGQVDDGDEELVLSDIKHISNSTPDQQRLSARMRKKSISLERRPPSYTTLHRAVTISRMSNRHRGANTCTQQ